MITIKSANVELLSSKVTKKFLTQTAVDRFNANLSKLVDDWATTGSAIYSYDMTSKQVRKSNFTFTPATLYPDGKGINIAKVELKGKGIPLNKFQFRQVRLTTELRKLHIGYNKKSYKTSKGIVHGNTKTYTKVAILKGKFKLVQVQENQRKFFTTDSKGYFFDKRANRPTAKETTPSGIYARVYRQTWRKQKRLPTGMLFSAPLPFLLDSERVLKQLKFKQRAKQLWKV